MRYGYLDPITDAEFARLPEHVRAAVTELRKVPDVRVSLELGIWELPYVAKERVVISLDRGPLPPGPHDDVLRAAGFTEQYPGYWVSHRDEDCNGSCEHFTP